MLVDKFRLLLDHREVWECSTNDLLVARSEATEADTRTVLIQNAYKNLVGVRGGTRSRRPSTVLRAQRKTVTFVS